MVMAYKFLKNNKDNVMRDSTHAKKKVVKAVPHKELKGVCDVYDFDYGYRPTPNNEHDYFEKAASYYGTNDFALMVARECGFHG